LFSFSLKKHGNVLLDCSQLFYEFNHFIGKKGGNMSFNNLRTRGFLTLLTLAIFVFFVGNINAQSGTTTINGIVTDAQGNAIPGASVKLSNTETGFSRTITASNDGTFNFPLIQPATYRLEVEVSGFKKYVTEVKALVDTPTNAAAVLEAGNINEIVTVTSNSAESLLNTQDASVGNTIVEQQVTQLPTEARSVLSLLTLQPGVTKDGYVAGVRSDQSNVTLDGVDINESQTNDISQPVLRLNSEAISEFRVTTTTANASQGRSSGAQISLITKGGTNEFRGSAFLTGRRTQWASNTFFNNLAGVEREKFDRDSFGGSIGGPIIKDRAFFFYSPEILRQTRGESVVRDVPLPTLGQGIVRFVNSNGQLVSVNSTQIANIFPTTVGGVNPFALQALAQAATRYSANDFTVGDSLPNALKNTAGYRFNADNKTELNSHALRLDFNVSSTQQAFARGNYISDNLTFAPQFPDSSRAPGLWRHPWGIVAGHTWTINSNLVNNFRFGLTRDAFTQQGDSTDNNIQFRFVYSPSTFTRTLSRVTPVYNVTDDLSLIWKTHTFQFGANLRFISNSRSSYGLSYDSAITNPSFYPQGALTDPTNAFLLANFGYQIAGSENSNVENAMTAVIGRFSQYQANFNFFRDGTQQSFGTPTDREFRTNEYDFYVQDIWKLLPNLTLTAGLRYSYSKPVWETGGYEVKPSVPLGEYFDRRASAAVNGQSFDERIVLDVSGKANGKTPLYRPDKNNFQPRVALAWSPNFGDNWLGNLFGQNGQSVIRGGFAITNDYFGQALAVRFDLNNRLGFTQSPAIRANFYNLTSRVGPRFTGFNQTVRTLPNLSVPTGNLTFPREAPFRSFPTAIEGGLDEDLVSPKHYSWSFTYERTLPKGIIIQASYLGRKARNLLAARDIAAITDYVDPVSKIDWYAAAGQLELLRSQGVPVSAIPQIPYFANIFPAGLVDNLGYCTGAFCANYNQTQAIYALMVPFGTLGGYGDSDSGSYTNYGNDWTSAQLEISTLSSRFPGKHIFYQPQYGTYGAWSTIGKSDYHAFTLSVRQRLGEKLLMDFNYTLSNSMDDGSGLQADAVTSGAGFLLNPFRQKDMYAASDFDMRHIINFNAVYQLPFGKGEWLFRDAGKVTNFLIGGWQLGSIFRYNTGLPIGTPYDDARWATNWNVQSYTTRKDKSLTTAPTKCAQGPKLFGCSPKQYYQNLRNALPGETGERNALRLPGYWVIDMNIGKTFDLPWGENHKLQFRWEVFNLTNTQPLGNIDGGRSGYGVALDPARRNLDPPTNWSNFVDTQGDRRVMQYVLRYTF
jgi:Carboxypeptidase regulatory-like domain